MKDMDQVNVVKIPKAWLEYACPGNPKVGKADSDDGDEGADHWKRDFQELWNS